VQNGEGLRVRVATGPSAVNVIDDGEHFVTRQLDGNWGYSYTLRAIGAFETIATWYIWLVDGTGTALSDPNFHFQTNNYPPNNPAACWQAFIDFVR